MPRIRSIKPETWADEKLAGLPRDARLLFLALISNADDDGRMRGSVLFVRAACFPYDPDLDVGTLMNQLSGAGFIQAYEADGQSFLFIRNFRKHQKIDRPTPSSLPPPTAPTRRARKPDEDSTKARRAIGEDSSADLDRSGSGGERKGEDASAEVACATIDGQQAAPAPTSAVWDSYSAAYETRYGEKPTRNKKVNGQLAHFVTRIPRDEAPDVAAFYVSHSGQLYVRAMHCVDLLLRDAEGLRTQWATGRQVTGTSARQQDRTAANLEAIRPLLRGDGS